MDMLIALVCFIVLMSGIGLLMGRQLAKANRRRMEHIGLRRSRTFLTCAIKTALSLLARSSELFGMPAD